MTSTAVLFRQANELVDVVVILNLDKRGSNGTGNSIYIYFHLILSTQLLPCNVNI